MVNVTALQSEQNDALQLTGDTGMVGTPLTPAELVKFGRSFERALLFHSYNREFNDIYIRRRPEMLLAAMIAKSQMNANVDGEQPAPGMIAGPLPIPGKYFGVGDDWEDINGIYNGAQTSWSTGSPQNWIHSGTGLLGGTSGNAVKILQNAVHCIIGIGILGGGAPKMSSVQFTIDGKIKPTLEMLKNRIGNGEKVLRIRELDSAIILKQNSTMLAKIMYSNAFGAPSAYVQEYPFFIGASFVREDVQRIQDPVNLPGTVNNVITTS